MDDLTTFSHTNITLKREPEVIRKLAILAGKIAYYNFEWRYVTLLLFNTVNAIGVETFMKFYGKSVVIKFGEFNRRHQVSVPQYVLFHQKTSDIQHYLEWLVENGFENIGKYIVVCVSTDRANCDEQAVLKTCMAIRLVNVIFLRVEGDEGDPIAFTIWPIRYKQCYDTTPVRVDVQYNNASSYLNLYPDKLQNLHRCPIKVSTFEQPPYMYLSNLSHPEGLDGKLLMTLMNALNGTFEIVQPAVNTTGYFDNNTWHGAVGEVYSKRAHISISSAPLTFRKYSSFHVSSLYNSMDIIWVSGMPPEIPAWEKLLNPLKIYIRITLFLMFVLIVVANTALKTRLWNKLRKVLKIGPPKSNLLFNSWLTFLGLPVSKLPKNWTLLIIVYQWVWFSFIIRSLYQATLISSLKFPAYGTSQQTLSEVIRMKLPFGGSLSFREFYSDDLDVYNKWKAVSLNATEGLLNDMSSGKSNFLMALSSERVIEYLLRGNGRQLQAMPEKVVNSPSVMFMKKFSSLGQPVDQVLSRLNEGGFTDRSYARYIQRGMQYFKRQHTPTEPLRMRHFTGPAVTLIFGWITSCFFFIVEIWSSKYEKRILSSENKNGNPN